MKHFIKLIRPHQWIKNGFLFLPLFFGLHLRDKEIVFHTIIAALAFSFVASAIYVLNDLMDIEEDRNHPTKKDRPLAAGTVTPNQAKVLFGLLLLIGLPAMFWLNREAGYLTLVYLGMNLAYSFKLKHIPILDISIIAIGFVLRLFIGSEVGDIPLSRWIILMSFLLALFLAFAKRRDDVLLANLGKEVRKSIDGYSLEFCNGGMIMMASVTVVAYISYCTSPEVMERLGSGRVYITVFFVILGILRYMQIAFVEGKSGSPTRLMLRDLFLQLTILGWVISFVVIIYSDVWLNR